MVSSVITITSTVVARVAFLAPSNTKAAIGLTLLRRCLKLPISKLIARSNNNSNRVSIVLNPSSPLMATSKTPSNILHKEVPVLPKVVEEVIAVATRTLLQDNITVPARWLILSLALPST